jgi:DNA-directed RNA polymerase specialized sigma24 family protein
VKPSFVTWQLRRLHSELDAIDKQRGDLFAPEGTATATVGRSSLRDRAARRALLHRMLRSLPKRLGFRDARAFSLAFARAHDVPELSANARRRLTPAQVRDLEQRVLGGERPSYIARTIGCAEQTVMNRASQLRKRLAQCEEGDGSGI